MILTRMRSITKKTIMFLIFSCILSLFSENIKEAKEKKTLELFFIKKANFMDQ